MVVCMKTTIEISDSLLREAKKVMIQNGQTFKELITTLLRNYMQSQRKKAKPFKWRCRPFRGDGLVDDLKGAGWEKIRERIYEGHGG